MVQTKVRHCIASFFSLLKSVGSTVSSYDVIADAIEIKRQKNRLAVQRCREKKKYVASRDVERRLMKDQTNIIRTGDSI